MTIQSRYTDDFHDDIVRVEFVIMPAHPLSHGATLSRYQEGFLALLGLRLILEQVLSQVKMFSVLNRSLSVWTI